MKRSKDILTIKDLIQSTWNHPNTKMGGWRGCHWDLIIGKGAQCLYPGKGGQRKESFTFLYVRMISLVVTEMGMSIRQPRLLFFPAAFCLRVPSSGCGETVGALMCLCRGHQWCHQLHCHVCMTHWVPDTHRRPLSCFHVCYLAQGPWEPFI